MYKFLVLILLALAACSPVADLEETPDPLGDFRLGFNIMRVSPNVTKGPISREATAEEWQAAMETAFDRRFSRFSGDTYYHIGATVLGYVLAQPGIPIVLSPKSVLIFEVIVIDNETQKPLNPEPEQLTVIEAFTGANIIGSGYTKTKTEQLDELAASAAKAAENWMRKQPWFFENAPNP